MQPPPPPPPPGQNLETVTMVAEPQVSPLLVLMNVINCLTHMFLGAIACSCFIFIEQRVWSTNFNQHIYLCVIGYIILMSTAIMSFDPNTSWSRNLKYKERRTSHALLQIAGSVLAITGTVIRINGRDTHFDTTHSILGLVAMILTFVSLIGGIVNFYMSGNQHRLLLKTVHSCVGTLTVVIAFTCLCFGLNNTFRLFFGDTAANMCISFTVLALVGVILPPTINILKRIFN